ncbi:MAG: DUF6455 family protein [Panacagrimonas sp.]
MVSIVGLWRRATRDLSLLPLWEVLRRRGARKLAEQQPQALANAVERCTQCADMTQCERLLAAGQHAKVEGFCPNAMYLKHLDAMQRHGPKRELLGPES